MKKLLLLIALIVGNFVYAQVGIGTDMPNPSTQLEIKSSERGVLIPQVPLTSNTDQTTISAGNVESLLVYNTSTNQTLTPGYYYWYQGSWHRLTIESDLPDNIVYWDVVNNQFAYADEYGNTQIINISDLETLTVLTDNGDGTFTYTDEDGNDVTFDSNTLSVTVAGGVHTFTDGNGDVITTIDTNASASAYDNTNSGLTSTNVQDTLDELAGDLANTTDALVDNGNGTFTHTTVDGTVVTFDANTTSMVDNNDGTYTLTNANGDSIVVDTNANTSTYDNTNSGLTSTNVQDALDELADDLANTTDALVDNGNGTFTHTTVDGTVVTFDANTTSMVDNNDGTYTLTNANGVSIVVDTNANTSAYDNSNSGLTSTNVQDALDEIQSNLDATTDALVDNGDGTFTHTAVDGTAVTFDANTTSVVANADGSYTFTDGAGNVITTVETAASTNVYDNSTSGLTSTTVQDALDELADDLANTTDVLVDNEDGTYTHTTVDGQEVIIDANTTSVTITDGVYTFTNGNGDTITSINTNANALGFDNTTNSLTSSTVQGAIEELLGTISSGTGVSLNDNADGTFSLVADNGTVISTITKSNLTDAGNGEYTFTNGDGTDISFDVNTVDVSLNTATNEYEFKDSEGNVIGSIDMNANNVAYDNTNSGLTSTNVQGALDELANNKGDLTVNGGLEFTGGTDGVDKLLSDAGIQIADNGITTAKIADGAVTTDKIGSGNTGEVLITDTNGDVTWENQEDFVKNLETLTSLTYSETENKLSYKDELGNTNEIQLNNTSLSYNSATQELVYVNSQGQTQSVSLVSLVVSGKDLTAADGSIIVSDGLGATLVDSNIKVADGGITTAKIADGAVTTSKVGENAITSEKISNGEVKAEDLGADSVDVGKVGVVQTDGTVVYQNVSSDNVDYDNTNSGLTSTNVQGALDELANNKGDLTVNGGLEFTGGTDGVDKLLSDAGIQIADNGITTDKIAPGNNDQVMVTDDQGDVVWVDKSEVGEILQATNGLNKDGLNIKLGGALTEPTIITADATNTLSIEGLQSGSIDDQLVVADANGTLKQIKAAMPKFFYMPAIIFNTSTTGSFTRDLHAEYVAQFTGSGNPTLVSSAGASSGIPTLPANELEYYITYYDTNVFANLSIDANGVLSYDIVGNATEASYMTIVFVVKD
ncbi:hypothetical protein J1D01_11655 [Seonamhaeicola sp. NFXS20]|uniref:beta strand repeat-containing protein n=1 Tax=Seonamhaeicola sp. NFXS20 TaxID=2816959 RepID=UPI003B8BBBED